MTTGDVNWRPAGTQTTKRFQSGGAIRPDALYIERSADEELPATLLQGEFCYVLAPRQMGKSSLRVRAAARLNEQGVRCATIDLQKIGSDQDEIKIADWYYSVLDELKRGLNLDCDLNAFWARHGRNLQDGDRQGRSTLPHCWSAFLQYEVLPRTSEPVVIFVDEIDAVLPLSFSTDDFFAVIRSAHESRPEHAEYNRLTFCLLGVAAPNDLIRDTTRTPFNIGVPIALDDFSWAQTQHFLPGLSGTGGDPARLLRAVFDWTDGQPYMTQKLCQELAKNGAPAGQTEEEAVRSLVDAFFLQKGRTSDANLAYAEDRFSKITSPSTKTQLLQLYRRLLNDQQLRLDADSPAQSELKLTGLAAERRDKGGTFLRTRNRIFATVFDHEWVREKEGERLFHDALAKWLEARQLGEAGREYLLRGKALDEGREWAATKDDVTKEERDFLLASQEQASKDAVALAEARSAKRLRVLSTALAVATVLALVALVFAVTKAMEAGASAVALSQRATALEQATQIISAEKSRADEARARAEATARELSDINAALDRQKIVADQARGEAVAKAEELRKKNQELNEQRAAVELARRRAETQAQQLIVANKELDRQKGLAVEAQKAAENIATQLYESVKALEKEKAAAIKAKAEAVNNLKGLYLAYGKSELSLQPPEPVRAAMYYAEIGKSLDPKLSDEKDRLIQRNLRWMAQFLDPLITLGERSNAQLSPDGRRLVSVDNNLQVILWDAQTGERVRELTENSNFPFPNSWSRDGRRLLTTTQDGRVQLWDAQTGNPVGELPTFKATGASAVYWSHDGRRLLTSEAEGTWLWDTQTGALVKELPTKLLPTRAEVSWSPDGRRLVTENKEGEVQLWDAETGAPVKDLLEGLTSSATKVLWVADGKRLVLVDAKDRLQLWDADTGLPVSELAVTFTSPDPFAEQNNAYLAGNSKRLLTSSAEGVNLWDALTGALVKKLPVAGNVTHTQLSRDGRRILTLSRGKVQLWDGQSGELVKDVPVTAERVEGTGASMRILTVSREGSVQLWDAITGANVRDLPVRLDLNNESHRVSIGGGNRLLTSNGKEVRLWDSRTGAPVATSPVEAAENFNWSEDGEWFTCSVKEGKEKETLVQLWDAVRGEQVSFLPRKEKYNSEIGFSWASKRLVTRNDFDQSVQLWALQLKPEAPSEMIQKVFRLSPYEFQKDELVYKAGREP